MVENLTCKNCKYFQIKQAGIRAWDSCIENPGKPYIIWGSRAACDKFKGVK